jgi:S-adenosylmethionine hydrolase
MFVKFIVAMPPATFPIITLTTDFGASSRYVAAMKGVILSITGGAVQLVDLTHGIPGQDIRAAARTLADAAPWFPAGTIHVAVVDPRVGTDRPIVYVEIGSQRFVAPDNGLLSCLAAQQRPGKIIRIDQPKFWLSRVSATFHGRDIMAPVAAHLALGRNPDEFGKPHDEIISLTWPEARKVARSIDGEIIEVDSFGNLVTNITRELLEGVPRDESVTVTCNDHQTHGIFQTYADQPPLTFIALVGSGDRLELAIVDDNAATMLGVSVGASVRVFW